MFFHQLRVARSVEVTTRGTLNSTFATARLLECKPSTLSFFFVLSTASLARSVVEHNVVDASLAFFHELVCSNSISTVVVGDSAFSSSASNPNMSRPTTLRDGGEVHFLWHVFKIGVASFSGFAGCRQLSLPLHRMFE